RSPLSARLEYRSGPANENGAAAPATPRAAAPAPAFLSSSRRLRTSLVSDMTPLISFRLTERSAGEPGDEAVEEDVVEEREWNARDQDRGHDPGPVEEIAADQVGRDPDRQRAVRRARDERDRVQKLVQYEREGEDRNGQDPRDRDRKRDADERREPPAAVHERGVLELLRNCLGEAH